MAQHMADTVFDGQVGGHHHPLAAFHLLLPMHDHSRLKRDENRDEKANPLNRTLSPVRVNKDDTLPPFPFGAVFPHT